MSQVVFFLFLKRWDDSSWGESRFHLIACYLG